ncbi:MAG: D-alanine--D-alanine ligase [Deltaproteobacteria bacterium]|nr:MAG: D-alanine--D-alanine ligase [Deltaproteobacteria bacterium]
MDKIRVAVIGGGWSSEREVSLSSAQTVHESLPREKYLVSFYDPLKDLKRLIDDKEHIDVAFPVLHGRFGEDGCIQGLLKILGIPFVGSSVMSSALAMNKKVAKRMYSAAGLDVPKDLVLRRHDEVDPRKVREELGEVVMVKPAVEGSSYGISLCRGLDEILAGVEKALELDEEVLIEEYVQGTEVTCCVLGRRELEVLPLIEIRPRAGYPFFTYEAKYEPGASEEICPAPLDRELCERIEEIGKRAHRILHCRVWSRTDVIIARDRIAVLETNTIPGMTPNSLFPKAARAAGMSLSELMDRLVQLTLEDSADSW